MISALVCTFLDSGPSRPERCTDQAHDSRQSATTRALAPLDLLRGLRILDLTTSIAGPSATQILADLGASIVKVERAGSGDDSRAWGPPFLEGQSLWFAAVNRNKQSLALNLTHSAGYAVFTRLVSCADAVITNAMPKAQAHLGVDYASLSRLKPDLVHVSITGFGLAGQRANLPCYDLIAEGYSGIMDLTGEADGAAQKVGSPAADLLAGSDAAIATIAALLRRQRDGKGCQIDVSMLDSMVRFVSPRVMALLGGGEPPRRSGGRDSVIAIYQVFATADDSMTLGLGNDAIWERFWSAVGAVEFGQDSRFSPAMPDAGNIGRRLSGRSSPFCAPTPAVIGWQPSTRLACPAGLSIASPTSSGTGS